MVTKSNKWYGISILLGILVVSSSLLGIIDPKIYSQETENWKLQAIGQDIGNLFAVMVFIISTHYSRKGSRFAFFVWIPFIFYICFPPLCIFCPFQLPVSGLCFDPEPFLLFTFGTMDKN